MIVLLPFNHSFLALIKKLYAARLDQTDGTTVTALHNFIRYYYHIFIGDFQVGVPKWNA